MYYTQRLYQSESDYAAMHRLIVDSYARIAPHHYMTPGDLDWWRYAKEDPAAFMATVPLWFSGTELAGFVWPNMGTADFFVHPDHRDLEPELIEWAMSRLPVQTETGEAVQLTLWSLESDDRRNQALRAHGFAQTEQFYTSYLWTFDAPAPAPHVPDGYTLRHMMGETDVEERVAVHRSAFHPSRMTVAKHRAVMGAPTYRLDLDIVIVARDASFAAYTIVWYDPINRSGLFEPVGVHADHRRKGLGRAVLYAGLQRLQALGAGRAHVLSHGDDSEGAKLYQNAGFATIDRFRGWKIVIERKNTHESKSAG